MITVFICVPTMSFTDGKVLVRELIGKAELQRRLIMSRARRALGNTPNELIAIDDCVSPSESGISGRGLRQDFSRSENGFGTDEPMSSATSQQNEVSDEKHYQGVQEIGIAR
jgi:hypothetical protein